LYVYNNATGFAGYKSVRLYVNPDPEEYADADPEKYYLAVDAEGNIYQFRNRIRYETEAGPIDVKISSLFENGMMVIKRSEYTSGEYGIKHKNIYPPSLLLGGSRYYKIKIIQDNKFVWRYCKIEKVFDWIDSVVLSINRAITPDGSDYYIPKRVGINNATYAFVVDSDLIPQYKLIESYTMDAVNMFENHPHTLSQEQKERGEVYITYSFYDLERERMRVFGAKGVLMNNTVYTVKHLFKKNSPGAIVEITHADGVSAFPLNSLNIITRYHDTVEFVVPIVSKIHFSIIFDYWALISDKISFNGSIGSITNRMESNEVNYGDSVCYEPPGSLTTDIQTDSGMSGSPVFLVETCGVRIPPILVGLASRMSGSTGFCVVSPISSIVTSSPMPPLESVQEGEAVDQPPCQGVRKTSTLL